MSRQPWDYRPSRDLTLWSFSFLFHLCLALAVGGLWNLRIGPKEPLNDRVIGVALRHTIPAREDALPPTEVHEQTSDSSSAAAMQAQPGQNNGPASQLTTNTPPPNDQLVIDLDAALEQMLEGDAPSASSSALSQLSKTSSEAALGDPAKRLQLDGEPGSASLFGLSGIGHRFVYVVDRSDSMNSIGGRPLRAAKRELKKSLQLLTDKQQFQLIFYNDTPKRYVEPGSQMQLLLGERSSKAAAERYIDSLAAFGGTEHMSALKMALRMAPDVIFFLTDARVPELNDSQLNEIKMMAERAGTTIYCIEFGTDDGTPQQSFLKKLASNNGGQYKYLNINSL